jgi:hypothetical protein
LYPKFPSHLNVLDHFEWVFAAFRHTVIVWPNAPENISLLNLNHRTEIAVVPGAMPGAAGG